jgi:hypothetical protein
MKKLLTLVFAIGLTASTAMFAQDATTTGTTTDTTSNKPQVRQGAHSKARRQHVKGSNGVSEQREERTNGNVEQRKETKKLKNGKVVTRTQKKRIKQ